MNSRQGIVGVSATRPQATGHIKRAALLFDQIAIAKAGYYTALREDPSRITILGALDKLAEANALITDEQAFYEGMCR